VAEWIPWTKGLPLKPEIAHLSRILGISRFEAACRCMAVWEWADENTVDGNARNALPALLDDVAGVTGFGNALLEVGWLLADDEGFIFPNWERWNTNSAKKRAQNRERQRRFRVKHGDAIAQP
jgi:hypothetical protein